MYENIIRKVETAIKELDNKQSNGICFEISRILKKTVHQYTVYHTENSWALQTLNKIKDKLILRAYYSQDHSADYITSFNPTTYLEKKKNTYTSIYTI